MAAVGVWTTCSWSDCGAASNTRTSTCGGTRQCRNSSRGWVGTSRTTTRSDYTSRWSTARLEKSIGANEPKKKPPERGACQEVGGESLGPVQDGGPTRKPLEEGEGTMTLESGVLHYCS